MSNKLDEFIDDDGQLIGGKIPPNLNPKTTARTTTDKHVGMVAQPFMYGVYRRFFAEGDLPFNEQADAMKDNPEQFHNFLKSKNLGEDFEKYFQKAINPEERLKEISREKAYKVIETILQKSGKDSDIFPKESLPTIDEIREKETLLLDKLDRIADGLKEQLSEGEKNVLLSHFKNRLTGNG